MNSLNNISVVVTGISWVGGGIGSIESSLDMLFRVAQQDIYISAYSISNGTDLIFDWLEAALNRGIRIRMVVNKLNEQPTEVVNLLHQLACSFPYFHLYDFVPEPGTDLHAKAIVVDRKRALVGSSNLSRRGIIVNYEMALLVEGPAVEEIAIAFERLLNSKYVEIIDRV